MKVYRGVLVGFLVPSISLLLSSAALAQSFQLPVPGYPGNALEPAAVGPEGTMVLDRARPDYDRQGVRVGDWLIYPQADLTETWDSNIFATQTDDDSDLYTTLSPSISAQSDWGRHYLSFNADGSFKWYTTHSSENVNNASANVTGRYDIERGSYFIGDAGYALQHEDRASPDATANAKVPTQYSVTGAYLGYVREEGRFGVNVDGTITSYSYVNNSTTTGQTIIENDRSRIEYVGSVKGSYEILPQLPYKVFVRGVGDMRKYNAVDSGQFLLTPGVSARRDSHGWEVDAGISMEITRLITAELYAGWLEQDYESTLFPSPSGPAFGGNLIWNPTPLDSVKASASQSIAETDIVGASSSTETNFELTLQHELLRNVILVANGGYIHDKYNGISRVDDTFGGNLGARYLFNRYLRAYADAQYSSRSSNQPGGGYDRIQATVGIQAGF